MSSADSQPDQALEDVSKAPETKLDPLLEDERPDGEADTETDQAADPDLPPRNTPEGGFGPHRLPYQYTQNRELSWLRFNERCLMEGADPTVPLLERLSFVSIFTSNLDEFFMVRVGGLADLALLKHQPVDSKSFETPTQQLDNIYRACVPLYKQRDQLFFQIDEQLRPYNIRRISMDTLTDHERSEVHEVAENDILPLLSPTVISRSHPFPFLENTQLYIAVRLKAKNANGDKEDFMGLIPIPKALPRIYRLPGDGMYYVLIEDIVMGLADRVFENYNVTERCVIRVTRSAEIDPDEVVWEDEGSYRSHMKKVLKKRKRLAPMRLEVQGSIGSKLQKYLLEKLGLTPEKLFVAQAPLDLTYVYDLSDHVGEATVRALSYLPFSPQESPDVDPALPMADQILQKDILLYYPYQSMDPFLRLLRESANDPATISIKITLYRVAKNSRLCESLIAAAENGKDVTVLMELRARFDEQNNIEWAERLEQAGCTVLYGEPRFKVHSKICLITRSVEGCVQRITQLGTGNYNEKTARLYTDYSLMTADRVIGEDANAFFRNMSTGNLEGEYKSLRVAPVSLRPAILQGIDGQIALAKAGKPAALVFKMNSLTDKKVIDRLVDASMAGVKVNLIIRGICCLLPGIKGETDNIQVISIVGRLLEHARVYAFGVGDERAVLLSSADMMTRNTEHRVEIAYPVLDPELRRRVVKMLELQLSDNVKARRIDEYGELHHIKRADDAPQIDAQAELMKRSIELAESARSHREAALSAPRPKPVEAPAQPQPRQEESAPQAEAPAPAPQPASAPQPAAPMPTGVKGALYRLFSGWAQKLSQ